MNILVTDQTVQIDLENIKYFISGLSVCTKPSGYKTVVFTRGEHKSKLLCRVIMNCPSNLEVDHIDGNTLNNCKANLRLATSQQNKFNTSVRSLSVGHKGVIRHGRGFKATITFNYKAHYLGTFDTEALAIAAYKKKADELFGEFALHNSRIN